MLSERNQTPKAPSVRFHFCDILVKTNTGREDRPVIARGWGLGATTKGSVSMLRVGEDERAPDCGDSHMTACLLRLTELCALKR